MQITVSFGVGNSVSWNVNEGTRISQLLADANLKARLNFGANVEAYVDGAVAPDTYLIAPGETVSIQTKANAKA